MNPQNLQETSLSRHLPHQAPTATSTSQKSEAQKLNLPTNFPDTSSYKKVGKWTAEEDELLRTYVSMYSEKQWKKVSEHIPGRAPIQCLHRWTKILKPGLVKGPWTQEEDQKLIAWVQKEGPGKWAQAANLIPGRSGKQCRERWFNNLNPEVRKGNWTKAEDELIFQLYQKYGSSWSKIAKYVSGRTENSIKNRFYSTLRKVETAKYRSFTRPSSQRQTKLETVLQEHPLYLHGTGSRDNETNVLYNLLHETTQIEPKQEFKENKEDIDVKVEEGREEPLMTKQLISTKNQQKDNRRILGESNNIQNEPKSFHQSEKGKENEPKKISLSKSLGPKKESRIPSPKIEENDSDFEQFLLLMDQGSSNDFIMKDTEHSDTKSFDELDDLQLKIFDFCNQNIQGLVMAFKAMANEPTKQEFPISSKELFLRQLKGLNPNQLQTYSQYYNLTPTGHSSPLQSLGVPTPKNEEVLSKLLCQQQTTRPFRPVAIKIPPLEVKETGETTIPRFVPFAERDLSSSIPVFPRMGVQEGIEPTLRIPLEKKENESGVQKQEGKIEGKVGENLNGLIQSMNQTIGAASLVYSHYVNQVNEAMKELDQKGQEESGEKVENLIQQIGALGNWLNNAKSELMRLESSMLKEEDKGKINEDIEEEIETKQIENKRRFDDDENEKDEIKGEEPIKKKKTF